MLPGPCTSTGTSERPVVVLMPSLPKLPAPHVHTVPSDLRITVPRAPPQMETTSAETATMGVAKANVASTPILAHEAFAFSQAVMFPCPITATIAGCTPTAVANMLESNGFWPQDSGLKLSLNSLNMTDGEWS